MNEKADKHKDIIHVSFEIGLLLKGLHGLLEVIGGISLLFLNQNRLNWLTHFLTQHELKEDSRDKFANLLISLTNSFSLSTQHFFIFYLMSHGIIKCILILLLWRRKIWAYPLSIVVLFLFIAYQIYRYTFTHSIFLIFISIFDLIMITLTFLEYKKMHSVMKNQE